MIFKTCPIPSIDLAQSIIDHPKETFEAFKIAAKEILDLDKETIFEVRAKNLHDNLSIPIRNIRSHHINRFIVTDGHVKNPKLGSFDNFEPISKQIGLPTPLISRFDLIFPIRDIPDKAKDETIADAILNKHINIDDTNEREIPLQLLKNYICYVSLNIKPKLSDEAREEIKGFFLGVRAQSSQNGPIGVKHRHLEGLIRMAEASAKLHMRDEVTVWDAQKSHRTHDIIIDSIWT